MTTVTILKSSPETEGEIYWAIAPQKGLQTAGETPGAALDALNRRLSPEDAGTLLVVQHPEPDSYFTEAQIRRLQELIERSRKAGGLSPEEEAERDSLIAAELLASARRSAALADALGR